MNFKSGWLALAATLIIYVKELSGSPLEEKRQRQEALLDCDVATWVPSRKEQSYFVLCSKANESVQIFRFDSELERLSPSVTLIDESPKVPNEGILEPIKASYFFETNQKSLYYVVAFKKYHAKQNEDKTHPNTRHTIIKISKVYRGTYGYNIRSMQTLAFSSPLVDFDINFSSKHCYLAVVLESSIDNLELYDWTRVQFDQKSVMTTYAPTYSVKLFKIREYYYIVVAQQQLYERITRSQLEQDHHHHHLTVLMNKTEPERPSEEYAKALFVGNAIFRFKPNSEDHIFYHQYIKLSAQANKVAFYSSRPEPWKYESQHKLPKNEQNFLIFVTREGENLFYRWSPLNQLFWPYQGDPRIGPSVNQPVTKPESPENCFRELERLLLVREFELVQLNARSDKVWRKSGSEIGDYVVNITTPVIVQGNVIVKGSILKAPQMVLVQDKPIDPQELIQGPKPRSQPRPMISPSLFENHLNIARSKLEDILRKLSHAIYPELPGVIDGQIKFLNGLEAREIIFANGVSNSDVRLNGLPFKDLDKDAVTLMGQKQQIFAHMIFQGSVVADRLDIDGRINSRHYLKDAFDINSREWQVIDSPLDFRSVDTGELHMNLNASINGIAFGEFVTRNRPGQQISGVKTFRSLTMKNLKIHDTNLNGYNLSRLAEQAIPLGPVLPMGRSTKVITGNLNFLRNVRVRDLVINNLINGRINLTSLIADSVRLTPGIEQIITGHKTFLNGLSVGRLLTNGRINDVSMNDVFTLRQPSYNSFPTNITGRFEFLGPVIINGSLHTPLINGIDLNAEAVTRSKQSPRMQVVTGFKTFRRPLRIIDRISVDNSSRTTVNGFDFHRVVDQLDKRMKIPPPIFIDKLTINGNLFVASNFINNRSCSLMALKDRLISRSSDDQIVSVPVKIHSLKAKSILVGQGGLNSMTFPRDFILKTIPPSATTCPTLDPETKQMMANNIQVVHGRKMLDHLVVLSGPAMMGHAASVNNITYQNIHAYIDGELRVNSTGQKFLQTMVVQGNIFANRINGLKWPEDILLRSGHNQRVYSPIVFKPESKLQVRGHLTMRGPINFRGRLNGFNLTQFVQDSVTYGDKDLLVVHRPIRNKIFVGGIRTNELLCRGLIDGVNFDEMLNRVVLIDGQEQHIVGPKKFMNVVNFTHPITVRMLNDLDLQDHINRVVTHDGKGGFNSHQRNAGDNTDNVLTVFGHKTILGTAIINKWLIVEGGINNLNLSDIQAKSISLSAQVNNTFNRTFIVEGDAYMDQMFIDEKHGIIDGVPLKNLIPIANKNGQLPTTTRIKSPVVLYTDVQVANDVLINGLPKQCNLTQALNNAIAWSRLLSSSSSSDGPPDPQRQLVDPKIYHLINNLALNSNVSSFHIPGYRRYRRQHYNEEDGAYGDYDVPSDDDTEERSESEIEQEVEEEKEEKEEDDDVWGGDYKYDELDRTNQSELDDQSAQDYYSIGNDYYYDVADDPRLKRFTKNAQIIDRFYDLPVDLAYEETKASIDAAAATDYVTTMTSANGDSLNDTTELEPEPEPLIDDGYDEPDEDDMMTKLNTTPPSIKRTIDVANPRLVGAPLGQTGGDHMVLAPPPSNAGQHPLNNILYDLQAQYDRLHKFLDRIRFYDNDHLVNGKKPLQFLDDIKGFMDRLRENRRYIEDQIRKLHSIPVNIIGFQDKQPHSELDESDLHFVSQAGPPSESYRIAHPFVLSSMAAINDKWHNLTSQQQQRPSTIILDMADAPPYIADSKNYTLLASIQTPASRASMNTRYDISDTIPSYTRVYAWNKQAPQHSTMELSLLPTQNPTNAKFVRVGQSLFLIVGQDPPQSTSCPALISPIHAMAGPMSAPNPAHNSLGGHHSMGLSEPRLPPPSRVGSYNHPGTQNYIALPPAIPTASLHVYLLQTFVSSNRFNDSSFDLFQSIDLPPISHLEPFEYENRAYLLAVSGRAQTVFLLKLRGYHGYQIIQQFTALYVDFVRILGSRRGPIRLAIISRQPGYSKIMTPILA